MATGRKNDGRPAMETRENPKMERKSKTYSGPDSTANGKASPSTKFVKYFTFMGIHSVVRLDIFWRKAKIILVNFSERRKSQNVTREI
jgi:hypothetical protein